MDALALQTRAPTLADLPLELLAEILALLGCAEDLLAAAAVAPCLRAAADEPALWRALYRATFGGGGAELGGATSGGADWRRLFARAAQITRRDSVHSSQWRRGNGVRLTDSGLCSVPRAGHCAVYSAETSSVLAIGGSSNHFRHRNDLDLLDLSTGMQHLACEVPITTGNALGAAIGGWMQSAALLCSAGREGVYVFGGQIHELTTDHLWRLSAAEPEAEHLALKGSRKARYGTQVPVWRATAVRHPRWTTPAVLTRDEEVAAWPAGRGGHTASVCGDGSAFLLFGGLSGDRCLGDLWLFDGITESWEELTPDITEQTQDEVDEVVEEEEEEEEEKGGEERAPQPAARWCHSAAFLREQNQLIIFGGWTQYGASPSVFLNDLWCFDLASRRWFCIFQDRDTSANDLEANGSPMRMPGRRCQAAMAPVLGERYVLLYGGAVHKPEQSFDDETAYGNVVEDCSDLWLLDLATMTWLRAGGEDFKLLRGGCNAVVQPGTQGLFIMGGMHCENALMLSKKSDADIADDGAHVPTFKGEVAALSVRLLDARGGDDLVEETPTPQEGYLTSRESNINGMSLGM